MRKILPALAAAVWIALAVFVAVTLTSSGHAPQSARTACAHGAQGLQCYQVTQPPCPRPALSHGVYSSYRTQGTMPSGSTVRLSDGDLYSCRGGQVVVTDTWQS